MIKKLVPVLLAFFVAYSLGILTSKYHLPPYMILKELYSLAFKGKQNNNLDVHFKNTFDEHFIYPISKYNELKYAPVKNDQQLYERINNFMVEIDSFENAYEKITLLSSQIDENILTLIYKYHDSIDTAYAFYKPTYGEKKEIGINIIPGSGFNQSSEMFYQNNIDTNYQSNIDDIANSFGDVFILVKPNEDFLAIHNGSKKIGEVSFVNHLINNGSSYSAYYLIQSLALSKFLESKYKSFYVCGLSQGGLAALINSLQSQPEKAIIASGFSVLMDRPYHSSHNQIIIPNYRAVYDPEGVKLLISQSRTQFLFTWGEEETGIFGIDANEKLTIIYLEKIPNVQSYVHPKGHIYYEPVIVEFLNENN